MSEFKIKSEPQRAMFEKAAADPEYARSRGITQDLALKFIHAHRAAGSPKLPEQSAAPIRVATLDRPHLSINDRPKGFGPRR